MSKKVSKRGAAKLLRDGAKLIEQAGWIQGDYSSPEGYCLLGALRKVAGISEDEWFTEDHPSNYVYACNAIGHLYGEKVPIFNDRAGMTKKGILRAMRQTAAKLEHGLVVKSV